MKTLEIGEFINSGNLFSVHFVKGDRKLVLKIPHYDFDVSPTNAGVALMKKMLLENQKISRYMQKAGVSVPSYYGLVEVSGVVKKRTQMGVKSKVCTGFGMLMDYIPGVFVKYAEVNDVIKYAFQKELDKLQKLKHEIKIGDLQGIYNPSENKVYLIDCDFFEIKRN